MGICYRDGEDERRGEQMGSYCRDEGEGGDRRVKEKGRANRFVIWFLQRLKGGTRGAMKVTRTKSEAL